MVIIGHPMSSGIKQSIIIVIKGHFICSTLEPFLSIVNN